ncbi:MAG: hypothetical protein IPP94_18465 [Ignavibacteria bacterium]|nr:hypothetical protein [Ignavibacteria bacterium]
MHIHLENNMLFPKAMALEAITALNFRQRPGLQHSAFRPRPLYEAAGEKFRQGIGLPF